MVSTMHENSDSMDRCLLQCWEVFGVSLTSNHSLKELHKCNNLNYILIYDSIAVVVVGIGLEIDPQLTHRDSLKLQRTSAGDSQFHPQFAFLSQ